MNSIPYITKSSYLQYFYISILLENTIYILKLVKLDTSSLLHFVVPMTLGVNSFIHKGYQSDI